MLSSIKLKFGSAPGQEPLAFNIPASVTIFVGPNNSGKSQILREIASFIQSGQNAATTILDQLTFEPMSPEKATEALNTQRTPPRLGETVLEDHSYIQTLNNRYIVNDRIFISALTDPNSAQGQNRSHFCQWYALNYVLALDGPSRVALVNPQIRGDLKNPQSAFSKLLTDNQRRTSLRKLIYDSTGLFLVLDASDGDRLSIRYGSTPPPNERSLDDETLDYMKAARGIENVSDGVKAFTDILLQLHVGQPKVIIIDEPEAFLRPSLAFTLGKEIARGAVEEGKHIFVSTHSPKFLMGAISSGARVNIVRLTYDGTNGTARLLANDDLTTMMQDPLLRSVGVLEGLFYNHVVVGEANADRAFYNEINERLLSKDDNRGVPHTLFLNADSKQTVPRIVAPLRKLGIPAAGVVDIDVLKSGGKEWAMQLAAIGIPSKEYPSYQAKRDAVHKVLVAAQANDFKLEGGINLLSGEEKEMAENLLGDLEKYGLFTVPHGEIENWLANLDVKRSKSGWLRDIFEKMGRDPSSPQYVHPSDGDVWDFFGRISAWIKQTNRKGIPI